MVLWLDGFRPGRGTQESVMPPTPQRPRTTPRHGRRRVLVRFGVALLGSVLLGMGTAAGVMGWGIGQIDRSFVAGLIRSDSEATASAPKLVNVLVVGNDSRDGLTRAQIRSFGTGEAEGNRTDSIMLVQLEVDGPGRGAVLSFPRDLLTTRCDGTSGRINAAYGIGVERDGDGPSCVVQTVSSLTGVDIHHYVEVSFAGFLEVVDALGGVGLYLLGVTQMRQLAVGMRRLTAHGLEVYTVPGKPVTAGGVSYVKEGPKAARRLYASFRSGTVVRDDPPPPKRVEEAKPPVTVINGTDSNGLARAGATWLEANGYTVTEVATAKVAGLERTRILHPPALASSAADLADLFPGADVIAGVDDLPLTVKLGSDHNVGDLARRAATARGARQPADAPTPQPAYRGAQITDVDC